MEKVHGVLVIARNILIFGADNNSLSHTNNQKRNFLVLGEVPIDGINGTTGAAKESINFSKRRTKFT